MVKPNDQFMVFKFFLVIFNISLYSFSEDLALEFGGLYPDSNRMLLLFCFSILPQHIQIYLYG